MRAETPHAAIRKATLLPPKKRAAWLDQAAADARKQLELPPHQIALQLGHADRGRLVRELYGHPDAAIAREHIRQAVREIAPVTTLRPTSEAVA